MAFDFGSAVGNTNQLEQFFGPMNKGMKALTAAIFGFSKTADAMFGGVSMNKKASEKILNGTVDNKIADKNLKAQAEIVDKLQKITESLNLNSKVDSGTSILSKIMLSDDQISNAQKSLAFLDMLSNWTEKKSSALEKGLGSIVTALSNVATSISSKKQQFEDMNEALMNFSQGIGSLRAASGDLVRVAINIGLFLGVIAIMSMFVTGGIILAAVGGIMLLAGSIWLFSKIAGDGKNSPLKNVGKGILFLSGAVLMLAFAGMAFQAVGISGMIGVAMGLIFLGLAFRLSNIASGDRGGDNNGLAMAFLGLAGGVIGLSLAAMIFEQTGMMALLKVGAAVLALAVAVGLANRISGGSKTEGGIGKSMIFIGLGLIIFAGAVYLWNKFIPDESAAIAPSIGILALAGAIRLMGKGKDVTKSAMALLIASASLIVLSYAIKGFDGISMNAYVGAGLSLAAVTGAVLLLGTQGKSALIGAAGLLVAAIGLILVSKALTMANEVSGGTYLGMGLFTAGLAATLILVGSVPSAIIGAGALVAGGVALILIAKALNKMKGAEDMFVPVALGIGALALSFIVIGNPFTLPFLLGGVAAAVGIGVAINSIANGLKTLKESKVTERDAQNAANMLDTFIGSMADTFDRNSGKMWDVMLGIYALGGLGNLMVDLANGVKAMANLEFIQHDVRNGKLVPVSVKKLTSKDFSNVGVSIGKILDAVQNPLAKIGAQTSGSWLFSKNPVADGIAAVQGLGSLMKNLAEGVQQMANLTFTEYAVRGGKIVPISSRSLTQADFVKVGMNFNAIVGAVKNPLEAIGRGTNWFVDGDLKNGLDQITDLGGVMTNLADGVLKMANMSFTKYKVVNGELVPEKVVKLTDAHFAQVGINFGKIINAIKAPLEAIGNDAGLLTDSALKNGLDELGGLSDAISPIVDLVQTFSELNIDDPSKIGYMVGDILKGLNESLSGASGMDFDTSNLIKVGLAMKLVNDQVNEFKAVSNVFDDMAESLRKINEELTADKFAKIMQLKTSIEDMTRGQLSDDFKLLLDNVVNRMAGAVQGIEKAVTASQDLPQVVSTSDNATPTSDSPVIQTKATQKPAFTSQNINDLQDALDAIRDSLNGTLQVSVTNQNY